jgi:hypothetical protein
MGSAKAIVGGRDHLFDPHALGEGNACSSENRIAILDQILWRFPRERFSNLLRRPLFARMIRYIEVHHPAAVMRQDDENVDGGEKRGHSGAGDKVPAVRLRCGLQ